MVSAQGSTPGVQPRTFSSKLVLWISGAERDSTCRFPARDHASNMHERERESTASSRNRADASGAAVSQRYRRSGIHPWTRRLKILPRRDPQSRRIATSASSLGRRLRAREPHYFRILFGRADTYTAISTAIDRYDWLRQNTRDSCRRFNFWYNCYRRNGFKGPQSDSAYFGTRSIEDGSSFRASLKLIADTGTKVPFDYYRIICVIHNTLYGAAIYTLNIEKQIRI